MKTWNMIGVTAVLGIGCASVSHIETYEPKRRDYEPPAGQDREPPERSIGSLWSDRQQAATLFTDVKAYGPNDVVTVRIEEQARARRDTRTQLDRDASFQFGADAAGKLAEAGIASDRLLEGASSTEFDSFGQTGRTEDVRFTVAATVTQVLPNGNLFLEGHRVVLVNDEEHHFYVSGVARPEDIRRDNSIASFQLADAEIEFTGLGVLSEQQKPGWLTRFFQIISPL
ncbi:MAG TPA: flagellar basal body L-ring protein FlgH [Myxococcales bacterium LLY-WYZ-16_1]|jgi:flagellar L-ring protein FlgH|nr:flagellar basal body L-ring protein FlgH [Myxococcales bacterium LLY-WYZ-16_1]